MPIFLRIPSIVAATVGVVGSVASGCDAPPDDSIFCRDWLPSPTAMARLWRDEDPPGVAAEAFEPVPLRLNVPLEPGTAATVVQGHDTNLTHRDGQRFALDFDVPIDTPVHAAAGGTVVSAVAGNTAWGIEERFRNAANRIVIDHGQGLFSAYVHLAPDGVLVAPGDPVTPGEIIGFTGLSGQMTGPHLHFHVEDAWSRTLPFRFFDHTTETCDGLFLQGETVTASDPEWFQYQRPSDAPPDLFEAFNVIDIKGFPARLWRRGTTYRVSGATTLADATEVLFMLLPSEGGDAVAGRRFAVAEDGTFAGTLTLGAVPPGEYGWALAATGDGGASVPRSVRCAVAP